MEAQVKNNTTNAVLVDELNQFLADMQIYYQNLRAFHWNVKGTLFFVLHEKFEEYYTETAEVIDSIAERILMIGGQPLHAFSDYLAQAKLEEFTNVRDGRKAVEYTLEQTEDLLKQMHKIQADAGDRGDEATDALFSDLISNAEKKIWMLRTFLA